jgi:hypothetical protein
VSPYFWLGREGEPEPWSCINLTGDSQHFHLGCEVEDDGWITIYPELPKQPTR